MKYLGTVLQFNECDISVTRFVCTMPDPLNHLTSHCREWQLWQQLCHVHASCVPEHACMVPQVCTAQYFVWYFSLASLVLPFIPPSRWVRSCRRSNLVPTPGDSERPEARDA